MGECKDRSAEKQRADPPELRELESKENSRAAACRKGDFVFSQCLRAYCCFRVYADTGQQYEPESVYISGISYINDDFL